MEERYYEYTLDYIQSIGDDLCAAMEGYKYLKALPTSHQDKAALTPEMEEAYKALAGACADFIHAYSYYSAK